MKGKEQVRRDNERRNSIRDTAFKDAAVENEYVREAVGSNGTRTKQSTLNFNRNGRGEATLNLTARPRCNRLAADVAEGLRRPRSRAPVVEDSDSDEDEETAHPGTQADPDDAQDVDDPVPLPAPAREAATQRAPPRRQNEQVLTGTFYDPKGTYSDSDKRRRDQLTGLTESQALGQIVPYKSSLAVRYTRARMDDDIRRHVLHLTDRKHLAHQTEIAHSRGGAGVGCRGGAGGRQGGTSNARARGSRTERYARERSKGEPQSRLPALHRYPIN